MHLTRVDAILLVLVGFVLPAYSYATGKRIASGRVPPRSKTYVRTIVSWWLVAGITLYAWLRLGRMPSGLGLTLPYDARSIAGACLVVALLAYGFGQLRAVRGLDGDGLSALRDRLARASAILPQTAREYALFLALSVTVGICEELLYRGYVIPVIAPYVSVTGAIALSGLAFGIGHVYQGWRGVAGTTVVGVALGVVYVLTGSLLWPAVLHALLDVLAGTIAYLTNFARD